MPSECFRSRSLSARPLEEQNDKKPQPVEVSAFPHLPRDPRDPTAPDKLPHGENGAECLCGGPEPAGGPRQLGLQQPAADLPPTAAWPWCPMGHHVAPFLPCAVRGRCQPPPPPPHSSVSLGGVRGAERGGGTALPTSPPGCQLEDHVGCDPFVSLGGKKKKCALGKNSIA